MISNKSIKSKACNSSDVRQELISNDQKETFIELTKSKKEIKDIHSMKAKMFSDKQGNKLWSNSRREKNRSTQFSKFSENSGLNNPNFIHSQNQISNNPFEKGKRRLHDRSKTNFSNTEIEKDKSERKHYSSFKNYVEGSDLNIPAVEKELLAKRVGQKVFPFSKASKDRFSGGPTRLDKRLLISEDLRGKTILTFLERSRRPY